MNNQYYRTDNIKKEFKQKFKETRDYRKVCESEVSLRKLKK